MTGAALVGVLVLQAALTLRLSNSAFQDEATYVFAGHRVLALWLHGTPTYDDYPSYFSGAPFLYPVAAAVADGVGGLEAARALSLICALVTTALLYLVARRLFDPAVAVAAAFVFAVSEPTLVIGRLATYDAAALLLVALAVWIGVRWSTSSLPTLAVMPPVLVLAIFTKYAALLYVPAAIAVTAIAVARDRGRRPALIHAATVTGLVAALSAAFLAAAPQLWDGMFSTTLHRSPGGDTRWEVASDAAAFVGLAMLIAGAGAVLYCRTNSPVPLDTTPRFLRILLAAVLLATGLAAPVNQMVAQTAVSLHKHVGFGLWFAAPLAGVVLMGLLRTRSWWWVGIVAALCIGLVWNGMTQSVHKFHDWPDSAEVVSTLRTMVRPDSGRYLVEEHEVPRYYLRDVTEPYQWIGTQYFEYSDPQGATLSGLPAYEAAIRDGYFDAVVLRYGPTGDLDVRLAEQLSASGRYDLVLQRPYETGFGAAQWQIWQRMGSR
ncbi:glycosyltransferase family 39 protein [Gordonia rhizosphera]|uniref:Glycosyltransferase RgtA/B/C/D-like domain-containing protein n=1 Tax=Gordonia rhizosphera NBRC 16068 TaxID=1108045 RepID=K6WB76_9ACTN|nr:glycosyltransferase family 39 protein [Gordonia rhizosphera]GAB91016.1 hypothetical protein GORHZ_121_00080 [Gordonia rhizosphera NBRC 16068]